MIEIAKDSFPLVRAIVVIGACSSLTSATSPIVTTGAAGFG